MNSTRRRPQPKPQPSTLSPSLCFSIVPYTVSSRHSTAASFPYDPISTHNFTRQCRFNNFLFQNSVNIITGVTSQSPQPTHSFSLSRCHLHQYNSSFLAKTYKTCKTSVVPLHQRYISSFVSTVSTPSIICENAVELVGRQHKSQNTKMTSQTLPSPPSSPPPSSPSPSSPSSPSPSPSSPSPSPSPTSSSPPTVSSSVTTTKSSTRSYATRHRRSSSQHESDSSTTPSKEEKIKDTPIAGNLPSPLSSKQTDTNINSQMHNKNVESTLQAKQATRTTIESTISSKTVSSSSSPYPSTNKHKYKNRNENNISNYVRTNQSVSAPVKTYTAEKTLSYQLIRGGKHEREKLLLKIRTGELRLAVGQFNEIVTALSKFRRVKDALQIVELAQTGVLGDTMASSKSVKSYTIMIDIYGRAFQLSKAFAIFYSMGRMDVQPNLITYNAMISACARNNEPDLAYEIFEEMKLSGLKADNFTFGALIDSCAKCGKVDRAFEISGEMEIHGVEKDETIYSALLDACGRTEQLERALTVFEEMKRNCVWPNLVTFAVLIDTCANAKQPHRAFQIFSEMKHWGVISPNVVVFTSLIDTCSKSGWPEKGEAVMQAMIAQGVEPNEISFGALMEGWSKQGRLDRAFDVLNRMITQHKVQPNSVLIGGLTDACRKNRESWRVGKLWQLIVTYNLRPSRIYYPCLIVMAIMEGDVSLGTAIVLHAFARGCLRRVSLHSDDPSLYTMACALIYYRNEVVKKVKTNEFKTSDAANMNDSDGNDDGKKKTNITNHGWDYAVAAKRVRIVFKSISMTDEEMDRMASAKAKDICLNWGDFETEDSKSARVRSGTRRDRKGVHRKDAWLSAQVRAAKNIASAAALVGGCDRKSVKNG